SDVCSSDLGRPPCSTCWETCGSMRRGGSASRTGRACSTYPVPACICMPSPRRAAAARWGTSISSVRMRRSCANASPGFRPCWDCPMPDPRADSEGAASPEAQAGQAEAGPGQILEAAQRLAQGRLVAFPTETVYGLGADAENPAAVARIYDAKRRPANHPVIVHLAPDTDPGYWAASIPSQARLLMAAFWPGPLTLILPRAARIPDAVSGGQHSIALRCPSHPVARRLLHAFSVLKPHGCGGVAAPSANQFGQVSPTRAAHVRSEFPHLDEQALMILEGGDSEVGIESTILDLSRLEQGVGPVLLRPGHVTALQIAEVLGVPPALPDAAAPRVSGSLKAHYAPRTP